MEKFTILKIKGNTSIGCYLRIIDEDKHVTYDRIFTGLILPKNHIIEITIKREYKKKGRKK